MAIRHREQRHDSVPPDDWDADHEGSAGGGESLFVKRVVLADYTDDGDGNGVTPTLVTLTEGQVVTQVFFDIIEEFNDSSGGGVSIDLDSGPSNASGNTLNDQGALPATPEAFGLAVIPFGGTMTAPSGKQAYIARGTVPLYSTLPGWADDGTTGIADIYIRIETPTAL